VNERVEVRYIHAGEGAADREPLPLVSGRGGGDLTDRSRCRGLVVRREARQAKPVGNGDSGHGGPPIVAAPFLGSGSDLVFKNVLRHPGIPPLEAVTAGSARLGWW